jgi:predicted nucleic acid-binding protein
MLNIYLDTNVYIYGLEYPDTNSALLLKELNKGEIIVAQCDYLFDEVLSWFRRNRGRDSIGKVRTYLISIPKRKYVDKFEWSLLIEEYDKFVADKSDLPHICSYFLANCDCFVTTNRRLTKQKIKDRVRFLSPTDLIGSMGIESLDTPDGI